MTKVDVRVRCEPNTESKIAGGLRVGDCVNVHGANAKRTWAMVENGALSGWVSLEFLEVDGDISLLATIPETLIRVKFSGIPTSAGPRAATPSAAP